MKKRIEAWAVVFSDDEIYDRYGRAFPLGKPTKMNLGDFDTKPARVVRLVEHDPAAARVVKAAVRLAAFWDPNAPQRPVVLLGMARSELVRAVSALRKGKK